MGYMQSMSEPPAGYHLAANKPGITSLSIDTWTTGSFFQNRLHHFVNPRGVIPLLECKTK
jgi:hypothetical protein